MKLEHWLTVIGWVVAPLIAIVTAATAAWAVLRDRVNKYDVRLTAVELQMATMKEALAAMPELQQELHGLVRQALERTARIEASLAGLASAVHEQNKRCLIHYQALVNAAMGRTPNDEADVDSTGDREGVGKEQGVRD